MLEIQLSCNELLSIKICPVINVHEIVLQRKRKWYKLYVSRDLYYEEMPAKRLEKIELGVENYYVWGAELVFYLRKLT